jgi:DNA mismatch endonuclease (patch repair protein)
LALLPSSQDFSKSKLQANVRRDKDTDRRLESYGWRVAHVWEHESPAEAADRITHILRALTRCRGQEKELTI